MKLKEQQLTRKWELGDKNEGMCKKNDEKTRKMLKRHRFEKHHEFQLYFHDKMDEEQTKIENRQMQMHSMIS